MGSRREQYRRRSRRTLHFEPSRVEAYERFEPGDGMLREAFARYAALRTAPDTEEEKRTP